MTARMRRRTLLLTAFLDLSKGIAVTGVVISGLSLLPVVIFIVAALS